MKQENLVDNKIDNTQNTLNTKNNSTNNQINNLSPNWGIMLTMQENLNLRIGIRRRKKYISAAFWNYISTPINFVITLFTALSASQTGTTNTFLSTNQVFYILLTTFILSIINTFFKLKEKAQLNYDSAKKYEQFGTEFEKIYFTPILNTGDVEKKLNDYNDLYKRIMTYSNNENIDEVNYITEFIFYIWIRKYNKRLRHIERNQRYWVLDGKPHIKYRNNYKISQHLFIKDFDEKSDDNNEEKKHGMFENFIHWFGNNEYNNEYDNDNDSIIDTDNNNENIKINIKKSKTSKTSKTNKTNKTSKTNKTNKTNKSSKKNIDNEDSEDFGNEESEKHLHDEDDDENNDDIENNIFYDV